MGTSIFAFRSKNSTDTDFHTFLLMIVIFLGMKNQKQIFKKIGFRIKKYRVPGVFHSMYIIDTDACGRFKLILVSSNWLKTKIN